MNSIISRIASIQCRSTMKKFNVKSLHTTAVFSRPAHDQEFQSAKERLNTLKEDPGNNVKLQLYGLFKQATVGTCNAPKPGMMDMDNAQKGYIDLVNSLLSQQEAESTPADAGSGVQYDGLKITRENKIFHIQLNRPTKKNAITWQMYQDIGKALNEAAENDQYSIAVLTGTGDYYCSGNDLSNFTNVTPDKIPEMARTGRDVLIEFVNAFISFPKPLIALVNGPAVGISVTTLGLCDAVYASDKATFHTPFSALGQAPEACSSYVFPKIMGMPKASELLLFNRKITAVEAKERNLISQIIPHDTFEKETTEKMKEYASFPPQSMRLSKILTRSSELETLKKVNKEECAVLEERWQSEECINAIMAFFTRKSKM